MKKLVIILGIASLLASCGGDSYKNAKISTTVDSASFSLGYLIGTDLKQNGQSGVLTEDLILAGIIDGLNGDTTKQITRGDAQKLWMAFLQKKQAEDMKKSEAELVKNKEQSTEFLKRNKEKEGVVTTESGLQYSINKKGTGKIAKEGEVAKVKYVGKLIDGTEFDKSKDENPFEVAVGKRHVIKGWDEVLQLMPAGSNWTVYIPSELAYGDRKVGTIPAGSALVFEIEVIDVMPPKESGK